jgi:hypothetical protein
VSYCERSFCPCDHPGWSGWTGAVNGIEAISSINCRASDNAVEVFPLMLLC